MIRTVQDLTEAIKNEFSTIDKTNIDKEPMVIELHSCRTGLIDDENPNPIAKRFSLKIKNAVIMAPNGYLSTDLKTGKETVCKDCIESGKDKQGNPIYKGKNPVEKEWRYFFRGDEIPARNIPYCIILIMVEQFIKSDDYQATIQSQ